ncbi:fumarylacetoacetate hydrolase domain-containing protein 2-like [Helicoverpa zea]|uniref:fumarylacetoacetate hydrolase domain-containing protein 2-like n=1 Tax=Helicoverpa zea TaxID=7113 RepID=UPI001F5AA833|nr:fumarylacetoacetate hydrolase domain-containing protein 2-like [Helicoverpa zea]
MKFLQFIPNDSTTGQIRVGYLKGDNVVDICCQDCSMPTTMIEILEAEIVDRIQTLHCNDTSEGVPLSSVKLVAPIDNMDKILGVALNYSDHCKEINVDHPPIPMIFSKFSSTIIGPNDPLRIRTEVCKKVDWEVELAVVIGKVASTVTAADADKYIFGYTIAQDISDREWQKEKNGAQFLLGKSQDTFCPIGPYIVTKDEIEDPYNLNLTCSINGVEKQNSNTSNIIHKIPAIIERISSVMTLLPGDLILTGTPGGTGGIRSPPEFLQPGDVIRSEIQNIGFFETKVEKF